MALKYRQREEIVGKRFLCLHQQTTTSSSVQTKQSAKCRSRHTDDQSQWQWKRGTVRAATHTDPTHHDLTILVEFDGVDWKRREWIRVYEQNAFQVFLIEYTLVWVHNKESTIDKNILWPSLNFKPLVDKIDYQLNKLKPIELLANKRLEFVDYNDLIIYQDSDLEKQKPFIESADVRKALQKWTQYQDSQQILLTTPSVLVGYRVKVYRSEGTTQWYTAVIVSYNENTRELTLTDDTVLEEHNEDPSLVQIKLIGDGVVESILKGEDIGITPRRRTCNQKGRVIATESKNSVNNNRNVCEAIQRKNNTKENRETKETTGNTGNTSGSDQQLVVHSHRTKRSSNYQQKQKSPLETKEDVQSSCDTHSHSHSPVDCNTLNESLKASESVVDTASSDTEIEDKDSNKCLNHHKRHNRTKRGRKKYCQSSGSDVEPTDEDSKVIAISSDTNVNEVKGSQSDNKNGNIIEQNADIANESNADNDNNDNSESAKHNELRPTSRTHSSNCSNANVITSAQSVAQQPDKPRSSAGQPTAGRLESSQCNACPMVPTMCSLDEQLNTSQPQPNDSKSESFPTRTKLNSTNATTSDKSVDQSSSVSISGISSGQLSGQTVPTTTSSAKVNANSDNNNNTHSVVKSETSSANKRNFTSDELNDPKRSIHSLALDRVESNPVSVYRDPNLAEKQIIRHIDSVQHLRHGLMHSVNTTAESSLGHPPEFSRMSSARQSQPPNLPPSVSSMAQMAPQYKMKSQPIHSSHPQQQQPPQHLLTAGSHASLPHSNSMDPQLYHHLMGLPPGLSAQSLDLLWQQKGYSAAISAATMPANSHWSLYNDHIRAQLLQSSDKHQSTQPYRLDRERDRREDKERHLKSEKEREAEKERVRQELILKEKEENMKDAVEQHFEESLRLARQKKSGWSPISNLPLTKQTTQANASMSRQSHGLSQTQHSSSHLPQPHQSVKSSVGYNSVDYERLSKEVETERWMAYVQQHSQSRLTAAQAESIARHKSMEQMAHQSHHSLQSSMMSESAKGSHSLPSTTSPVMEASKPLMTQRAKTEPSFSLYGYQPNQSPMSYITPAQLKENNRLNMSSNVTMSALMTGRPDLSKVGPPAAHGLERRESPKASVDRSLTPNSRNSTPIGRPPSLSPKTSKSPKMMAPMADRISPLYARHQTQSQGIKPYEGLNFSMSNATPMGAATAPPAHQNASSRAGTPLLSSSPISLQLQSQIPVAHSSQTQEQPQNLVKSDSKAKLSVNELSKSPLELQRESPKSSTNMSAGYQSFPSLIQQGLVPNPLYKPSGVTTQSITKASSMPSVITRPQMPTTKTSSPSLSPHMSQKPHVFSKPGPGIVSGIPICRPNSIPYYDLSGIRPNPMNQQKYPQQMPPIKSDPINTYPELNRTPKLPTHPTPSPHSSAHSPFAQTQDRNVFHRMAPSPHSPRISSGSVPQSPYGPAPGMVPVSAAVAQSHSTPPAAHSGTNAYNNLNIKRKSIENIVNTITDNNSVGDNSVYPNKKLKVIESQPIASQPQSDNSVNVITKPNPSPPLPLVDHIKSEPSIDTSSTTIETKVSVTETTDFLSKHQKAMSVASRPSTAANTSNPTNASPDVKPVVEVPVPVVAATVPSTASTSSFHPRLKKAWLQRHSEDKTGGSTPNTSTSANNNFNSSVVKNISESSNTSSSTSDSTKDSTKSKSSDSNPINGGLDRKSSLKDDDLSANDETSSASEAEMSNSSKGSKRKANTRVVRTRKRVHQNRDKDSKKRKSNPEFDKSENNVKTGKENEDKKKRDKGKDSDRESSEVRSTTRRGRKPKALKNEEREKSSKESSGSSLKKKVQKGKSDRTAIAELKKTGAHFLQGGSCVEVAPKLPKCRECRMTPTQRNRKPTIFCRFYDYRKLAFKNNVLTIAGFSQPQDATEDDLKLWLPSEEPPSDVDVETARFVITHVGDQFCDLVKQEKEAQLLHMGSSSKPSITWKRVVQGVREMCDVCETTLFNIHWVCDKCGFVVCIDCYKARKVGSIKEELCPAKDRDGFQWLLCNNRQQHEPHKLEVTQIIAAQALSNVGRMLHTVRARSGIQANCSCVSVKDNNLKNHKSNGFTKGVLSVCKIDNKQVNGVSEANQKNWKAMNGTVTNVIKTADTDPNLTGYSSESGNSPLSFFVDVALTSEKLISKSPISEGIDQKSKKKIKSEKETEREQSSDADDDTKHSTLRELLMGPTSKTSKDGKPNGSPVNDSQTTNKKSEAVDSLEAEPKDENSVKVEPQKELQHFHRRYFPLRRADPLPVIRRTVEETKKKYPQIPHNWFSDGRLLVLHDPKNSENILIFQEQWIRGQPVVVKDNHKNLNSHLWHPDSFSRDFGDVKNDLINCLNQDILSKQPMRKFWDGFENLQIRMKDKAGECMLLKLKDWPPDEEFSDLLPSRYKDLMSALPLPEYTNRNGVLNLAGRLPDCFVRPDLGPKMYSAYGSTQYPDKGTTNLHLDISDAVNVMIFVGIPKESHKSEKDCHQEVLTAVDSAGCDELMRKRVREKGVKVGAIWHIYGARDADKIRDLLNKVAIERGETPEPHHDPIHDQSWYLDDQLRSRLLKEYGVEGYAIAQCLGDAIFIPAGAPHQVRNLNSCIKVAGDFVSPENVSHCFHLTQEFRQLSDTHTNHEDKLQIKNIIYHAVKDAVSVLKPDQRFQLTGDSDRRAKAVAEH